MDIDRLRARAPELAAHVAFYSAANVVAILNDRANSLDWPALGAATADSGLVHMADLAAFARANSNAPAESLYRFAGGRAMHACDPSAFESQPLEYQVAFSTFGLVLRATDRAFAAEISRLEWAAMVPAPALAGVLAGVPIEDTVLARASSPTDPVPDATASPEPEPTPAPDPTLASPAPPVAARRRQS